MRNKKVIFATVVSVAFLSTSYVVVRNNSPNNSSEEVKVSHVKKKKHAATNLPVTIYVDSEYNKLVGRNDSFSRIITGFDFKEFNDSEAIRFKEVYGNIIERNFHNFRDDYKLLVLYLTHKIETTANDRPLESFMLNKGSALVIGDDELGTYDDLVLYQQEFLTTDYRVKRSLEPNGEILLAVPKSYAENKDLQLRISEKIDGESSYVYLDLN
ncbi:hypothetical protein [Enterococcus sp. AZ196]|uniref:hypothetical protein n=1 Tax=Enterococcus sp. AZ196 TaxID=2774659 RepID=UPI003D2DDEF7